MALPQPRTAGKSKTKTKTQTKTRAPAAAPSFRAMDRRRIDALLARNHVGRIAYSFHDRVDIEPIHYVFDDGVLCLRTSPGSKLTTVRHNPWVAFEVDEIRGLFAWRSVVVHGTLYATEDGTDPLAHAIYERTLGRLRTLVPGTFHEDDPAPFRYVLFRLHVAEATGREASSRRG
jgi:nitroimidazol reductase NimA-like FMN-containing flavoprotein (pyridoxamine 5'-phosphate oxidase superfamily)